MIALVLVFAAHISLVSGEVPQTTAFYFVPPPGVDEKEGRQLEALAEYIESHLEGEMPEEIDEIKRVGEKQVRRAQGLKNHITANPQIQYLVQLNGLSRIGDIGPWVFKCYRYQKKAEGTDRSPDLQKCRPFMQKIVTLNDFQDVENFSKLVAISVFPPAAVERPQLSGDKIVYTTCFGIAKTVESRRLVKILHDKAVWIPKKLAGQMRTLMKEKGYRFDGLTPIDAELCFGKTPPHPPKDEVWHYELVGTIGYRLEEQELIVSIVADGKGQNTWLIQDENQQPLVIKKLEHSFLQIKLAEFIYKHWERIVGGAR